MEQVINQNQKVIELIEKYKTEVERLKGVRDRQTKKEDKEYFQGHIDALLGSLHDLEDLFNIPSSKYEGYQD